MSAPISIRVHADRATLRDVSSIRPSERNARTHSKAQIRQLALIIQRFGYTQPVLVDANGTIIGGHARLEAAKLLGMTEIPVIKVTDLTTVYRQLLTHMVRS